MNTPTSTFWSRRALLKSGLGILGLTFGGLMSSRSLAALLTKPTPRQALGPFFPDDGDEVNSIRENPDPNLPISQANDQNLTVVKGRKGKAQGQVVYLIGRVLHAKTGQPIPNSVLIMWSASASGRYNHTGDDGTYSFPHPKTGKPLNPSQMFEAAVKLSRGRAETVISLAAEFAKNNMGIIQQDLSQIHPVGVGFNEPVIPLPSTTEEQLKNMRVELCLIRSNPEVLNDTSFDEL